MKNKFINLSVLALLALGVIACSDDDSQSPESKNATLLMKSSAVNLKTAYEITFAEATIHVEEVEFESLEIDGDDFDVDFEGPFAIDLLTGNSQPKIPTAYLLPGKYEEVEVELDDDISPNIQVAGSQYIDEENSIDFVFTADEDIDFEAEAEDIGQTYLFEVVEGENINIVMEFKLNEWFKGVEFSSGIANGEGVVVVSKTENEQLYQQIIRNIEQSKLLVYAD
ncbi:hypothetical protein KEM09_17830 [Carboxylicivirga mesophila]|uniref:DUF4382 domain-containing protein n=1 Tax=Carboxylicivirga mesophila TaxID=1166478 RepID=A0ABS5KE27_9BACT|nr:DUF4382 domain-containing protein [Carboxylicivirga mesophila]MBS2213279.1 hypothetical protein [Carboxylicivirga mesophila]